MAKMNSYDVHYSTPVGGGRLKWSDKNRTMAEKNAKGYIGRLPKVTDVGGESVVVIKDIRFMGSTGGNK